jgi:hypothetical protein
MLLFVSYRGTYLYKFVSEEKCPAKGAYKNTRRDDDTIIKNNKSNGKLRTIIFFLILSYLYYCYVRIQIYTNKSPYISAEKCE